MLVACPFPQVHFGVEVTKVWGKVALKPATKSKQMKWSYLCLLLLTVWLLVAVSLWSDTNRPPVRVGVEALLQLEFTKMNNNCARATSRQHTTLWPPAEYVRVMIQVGFKTKECRLSRDRLSLSLNASANSSQSDGGCLLVAYCNADDTKPRRDEESDARSTLVNITTVY